MARKSLRPYLNQIRTWTRQGRTDAWVAHQLEVTVQQIASFKRESGLLDDDSAAAGVDEEIDLRAEDDARIAAELEAAELERREAEEAAAAQAAREAEEAAAAHDEDAEAPPPSAAAAARSARAAARPPRHRSRGPSTTARRATGCGSTPPSPTTPSTPSTGPGTGRSW